MTLDTVFKAPSKGNRQYPIYLLWVALAILSKMTTAAQPTVPTGDYRQALMAFFPSVDAMDEVLAGLRKVRAIDQLNTKGTQNRRYLITAIGRTRMATYQELLEG